METHQRTFGELMNFHLFAYQCSLAGIFNNHQWTPNQSTAFIQLAKKPNTTWDIVVSNVEAGVLQVDLEELVVFGVESNITSIATFLELTKWFFLSIFFIFFFHQILLDRHKIMVK